MKQQINHVLVLGASGAVGSLVGGLLAQHGYSVGFLSRTIAGTQKGLQRAIRHARSETIASRIKCGDYDANLAEMASEADWIVECLTEDVAIKKEFYLKLDRYRKPQSIVSSVTSSLPLDLLMEGLSSDFQQCFLSTHFYNPPSKMLACEICGTAKTNPEIITFMSELLAKPLQRVIIPVNNTVAFAGNRIAFLLFNEITRLVEQYGVEMMDYLLGPYTGRSLAPLATIDLVGLDIHKAIIESLRINTKDKIPTPPAYIDQMISSGCLGNKTRSSGGFYKRLESGNLFYDPASGEYIPAIAPHFDFVEKAKQMIHLGKYKDAFLSLIDSNREEAKVVVRIMCEYVAYSYSLIGTVTEDEYGIGGIDDVMSHGFNWAGPSLIVRMFGGRDRMVELIREYDLSVPEKLLNEQESTTLPFNYGRYFKAI